MPEIPLGSSFRPDKKAKKIPRKQIMDFILASHFFFARIPTTAMFSPRQMTSIGSQGLRLGFSLVELLVTMAILSILTAIAVPTAGLLSASKLNSAGNDIADVLTFARHHSLSTNSCTAVVIKTQDLGAYSAYCILKLIPHDDGSYGSWVPLTSWRYLPKGVLFDPAESFLVQNAGSIVLPTSCQFQGQNLDLSKEAVVQIYRPNGTVQGALSSIRLRLVEAVMNADNTGLIYNHPGKGTQTPDYYDIVVLRDTGQTKIERP